MPTSTTADFPAPPAHGYRGDAEPSDPITRPRGLAVAISRQAGARGTTIARRVGAVLGWQVLDNETLDYLVEDETARSQFLAEVPEGVRAWVAAQVDRVRGQTPGSLDPGTASMAEIVLSAAARGDVVIVGRGAGYLLPTETTLHVRVVAPLDARVAYFAQWLRLSSDEAAREVAARDGRRAQFVATLGGDPADPTGYDLVVNAGRLGIEGTAQYIGWAVRTKQMFAEIHRSDDEARSLNDIPGA
ncbi:AAA family ATPase [Gemmata sp.]|uniref:cytidylate kinase-like family protein n=1 Tax=Gemmata sp. TaxID=1914242 RepID=UPI003F6F093D